MVDLLLDSSFLIFLADNPTGGFGELGDRLGRIEPVVLDSVIAELRGIAGGGSAKRAKAASRALEYALGLRRISYSGGGDVDDQLLGYARSRGAVVATLDAELRRRLRAVGLTVVALRGNRMVIEGR